MYRFQIFVENLKTSQKEIWKFVNILNVFEDFEDFIKILKIPLRLRRIDQWMTDFIENWKIIVLWKLNKFRRSFSAESWTLFVAYYSFWEYRHYLDCFINSMKSLIAVTLLVMWLVWSLRINSSLHHRPRQLMSHQIVGGFVSIFYHLQQILVDLECYQDSICICTMSWCSTKSLISDTFSMGNQEIVNIETLKNLSDASTWYHVVQSISLTFTLSDVWCVITCIHRNI